MSLVVGDTSRGWPRARARIFLWASPGDVGTTHRRRASFDRIYRRCNIMPNNAASRRKLNGICRRGGLERREDISWRSETAAATMTSTRARDLPAMHLRLTRPGAANEVLALALSPSPRISRAPTTGTPQTPDAPTELLREARLLHSLHFALPPWGFHERLFSAEPRCFAPLHYTPHGESRL